MPILEISPIRADRNVCPPRVRVESESFHPSPREVAVGPQPRLARCDRPCYDSSGGSNDSRARRIVYWSESAGWSSFSHFTTPRRLGRVCRPGSRNRPGRSRRTFEGSGGSLAFNRDERCPSFNSHAAKSSTFRPTLSRHRTQTDPGRSRKRTIFLDDFEDHHRDDHTVRLGEMVRRPTAESKTDDVEIRRHERRPRHVIRSE